MLFFKYPNFFNFFLNLFCGLIKLIIFVKIITMETGQTKVININFVYYKIEKLTKDKYLIESKKSKKVAYIDKLTLNELLKEKLSPEKLEWY